MATGGGGNAADWIPLVLSSGAGAFALAIFQGWRDARQGARQGQRETVDDLIRWRDDLDRRRQAAESDRDYWRDLCAQRGNQLRRAGIEPVEPDPVPPSERRRRSEDG